MPEDSKKNDRKNAKEQRKPRQRHQHGKLDKKTEKVEEDKIAPIVPMPQKPPVYESPPPEYESPPPEFFKNLKRETDEILKITEEENIKYKKKEIQSNWSKYEVQIESYEEIDEQENLGADFEKLIQAPLVAGGHFQFKHEKSWDVNTGPTQYDKYFEIDMENLNLALCTIPFYERNNIEKSTLKEVDILTMINRATKFKQKYFNDKSFVTPETEVQDKILNSLRNGIQSDDSKIEEESPQNVNEIKNHDMVFIGDLNKIPPRSEEMSNFTKDINWGLNTENHDNHKEIKENMVNSQNNSLEIKPATTIDHDDIIFGTTKKTEQTEKQKNDEFKSPEKIVEQETVTEIKNIITEKNNITDAVKTAVTNVPQEAAAKTQEVINNPVIESPEDLEKWLDDFLDG